MYPKRPKQLRFRSYGKAMERAVGLAIEAISKSTGVSMQLWNERATTYAVNVHLHTV